jgi:uncharacterized OsmC-like protein
MTSKVEYQGDLRTVMVHLQSNDAVITDAPTDNHGKGEAFSPTDLVATALASCMMTIMGIKANDLNIDISGTHATVKKHMSTTPRRISEIEVKVYLNQNFDSKTQTILEKSALTCPVGQSLHPETKQTIQFIYPKTTK